MSDSRKGWAAIGMAARSVALHSAQLRPAAHKQTLVEKTNPPAFRRGGAVSDAQILREVMTCSEPAISTRPARSTAHNSAQQRSAAHRPIPVDRTNPRPLVGLTSRQLAAARLIAQGMRSSEVAKRLTTIPQTINRWKHLPQFQAELRRLHELLVLK